MDQYLFVIIIIIIIIVLITLVIMGNKAIQNNYDMKMYQFSSELNNTNKNAFNIGKQQDRIATRQDIQLNKNNDDINKFQNQANTLNTRFLNFMNDFSKFFNTNEKSKDYIKESIKNIDWSTQQEDISKLTTKTNNMLVVTENNINYNKKQENIITLLQDKYKQLFTDLNSIQLNLDNLIKNTSTVIYNIQGKYIQINDINTLLNNYVQSAIFTSKISNINNAISQIANKIQNVPSAYSTISNLTLLKSNLSMIQTQITTLTSQIDAIDKSYLKKSDLENINTDMGTIDSTVSPQINTLQSKITSLQAQVDALTNIYVSQRDFNTVKNGSLAGTQVCLDTTCINRAHFNKLSSYNLPINCVTNGVTIGACSKTCGGGTQPVTPNITTAAAYGGTPCPAPTTRACNTQPCPVNCQVGSWSTSTCSKPCGGGTQTVTPNISVASQYGGTACPSAYTQNCNTQSCSIDCITNGVTLGQCSKTCGGGTQTVTPNITKTPAFGGTACPPQRTQACNTQPCPVNCQVSSWSTSACSKTCGGGTQTVTPNITTQAAHGGTACPPQKTQACNTQPCINPVDCQVGSWSTGACSKTCGGGTQTVTPNITRAAAHGGTACPPQRTQACNTQPCPVNCQVGSWSTGACSKTCGGGTQTVTPNITTQAAHGGTACPPQKTQDCNTQACPLPPMVTLFEHCGYGGYQVRLSPGKYNFADLRARGGRNDDISSIKIQGPVYAVLFSDDNLQGSSLIVSKDTDCLTNFNDKLSSIYVVAR